MKILVVSNMFPSKEYPSYGVFVKNFCSQIEALGISYDISAMKKGKNNITKIFRYLLFYTLTFLRCILFKYDLIYVHYASNSGIPVLWASKFRNIKIYTNVHGSDVVPENEKQEKMQKYTNKILKMSTKIVTPSDYFKDYVSKKYDISTSKIYVSYSGGVDENKFFDENREVTQSETLNIGYVGRITVGKGWDTLLRACSLIEDYKLTMVGSGNMYCDLERLIKELELSGNVELYPLLEQDKLRKIYNEIDVFVFPTEREGESLGLVAIEAMACGTPVIASNYAAPAFYVQDGINGYKFEKNNAQDLADKLNAFRKLTIEQREKLKIGAERTAYKYRKEAVIEQMRQILLEEDHV